MLAALVAAIGGGAVIAASGSKPLVDAADALAAGRQAGSRIIGRTAPKHS